MQFRIKEVNGKFTPQKLVSAPQVEPYWIDLSGWVGDIEVAQEKIDEYVTEPTYHEYVPTPKLNNTNG